MHSFPVPSLIDRNIWHCYMVLKYWTYCCGDASYILFLEQINMLLNFYLCCFPSRLCIASLLLPFLIHLVSSHEEQSNTDGSQFITSRSDTVPLDHDIK